MTSMHTTKPNGRRFAALLAAAALAVTLGALPVRAGQYGWDNTGGNSLWSNLNSWRRLTTPAADPATELPGTGDYATFTSFISGAQTVNVDLDTEIQTIQESTYATGNYTVQAKTGTTHTLTLNGGSYMDGGYQYLDNQSTIDGLILQNGPGTLTLSLNSGTSSRYISAASTPIGVTINCPITENTPASGFIKGGSGIVILGAANTYSGNTRINAGTLQLNNANAMQNSTLDMSDSATDTGTLSFGTLTAATIGGLMGSRDLSLQNDSAAAVALTVGNNNTSPGYYTAALTGSGSVIKVGTGTLTLAAPSSFTGGMAVQAGTVQAAAPDALATSPLTLAAGAIFDAYYQSPTVLSLIGAGNIINNYGTLSVTGNLTTASSKLTYSCFWGTMDSGALLKDGTHAMALRGTNTTSGRLQLTPASCRSAPCPMRCRSARQLPWRTAPPSNWMRTVKR